MQWARHTPHGDSRRKVLTFVSVLPHHKKMKKSADGDVN